MECLGIDKTKQKGIASVGYCEALEQVVNGAKVFIQIPRDEFTPPSSKALGQ